MMALKLYSPTACRNHWKIVTEAPHGDRGGQFVSLKGISVVEDMVVCTCVMVACVIAR